jgi:hypothetical protein
VRLLQSDQSLTRIDASLFPDNQKFPLLFPIDTAWTVRSNNGLKRFKPNLHINSIWAWQVRMSWISGPTSWWMVFRLP